MTGFLSPDGFPPSVWGPLLWQFMHILAANMPLIPTLQQSTAYHAFFSSLCTILPCKLCRAEFCALVTSPGSRLKLAKSLFMQLRTEKPGAARKRVFRWTVLVHAAVNKRLSKKGVSSSLSLWSQYYAGLRTVNEKNVYR